MLSLITALPQARKRSELTLVKYVASSQAESPPPTTARGLRRKMGTAPSQTAHAEMPLCQYVSSPGRLRRRALAPVAMMIVSAVSGSSSSKPSLQYRNGRRDRSILLIVSVKIFVPNRSDCALKRSIISGPRMPSGKPGNCYRIEG